MKLKFIIVIVALLTLGMAAKPPTQSSESSAGEQIDAVFSAVTSPDAPGLAVLARKNGKDVFERGYGVHDLHSKAKIDAHSNFRLASFTKQFTAMAAMLLVRDGKLRYDETLTEVFPDFPAYGKPITIRNLLNHTVAVGTTIADRPPHRSVQARLRIRLLSWMSGGKAGVRIRMQNAGLRNPAVQERDETIPSHLGAFTATD